MSKTLVFLGPFFCRLQKYWGKNRKLTQLAALSVAETPVSAEIFLSYKEEGCNRVGRKHFLLGTYSEILSTV